MRRLFAFLHRHPDHIAKPITIAGKWAIDAAALYVGSLWVGKSLGVGPARVFLFTAGAYLIRFAFSAWPRN